MVSWTKIYVHVNQCKHNNNDGILVLVTATQAHLIYIFSVLRKLLCIGTGVCALEQKLLYMCVQLN